MPTVASIVRKNPPEGPPEVPFMTPHGYKLADPSGGAKRHHADHAVHVRTLDEAAALMSRGFPLWMKQEGKRETLISPRSLCVVFA